MMQMSLLDLRIYVVYMCVCMALANSMDEVTAQFEGCAICKAYSMMMAV